jgi:hypothetical protein
MQSHMNPAKDTEGADSAADSEPFGEETSTEEQGEEGAAESPDGTRKPSHERERTSREREGLGQAVGFGKPETVVSRRKRRA